MLVHFLLSSLLLVIRWKRILGAIHERESANRVTLLSTRWNFMLFHYPYPILKFHWSFLETFFFFCHINDSPCVTVFRKISNYFFFQKIITMKLIYPNFSYFNYREIFNSAGFSSLRAFQTPTFLNFWKCVYFVNWRKLPFVGSS